MNYTYLKENEKKKNIEVAERVYQVKIDGKGNTF